MKFTEYGVRRRYEGSWYWWTGDGWMAWEGEAKLFPNKRDAELLAQGLSPVGVVVECESEDGAMTR